MNREDRFTGKVCIVTGGGSGIGRSTCLRLAAEGAKVVVVDIDEKAGSETASLITSTGKQAVFIKTDVAKSQDVRSLIEQVVDKWQVLDVLVNVVGVMTFARVTDLEESEWDRVIDINLKSVFLLCKYSLPHITKGAIVNVSSVHAHATDPTVSAYATSKAGIEAFTRALSREYEPTSVRVNCVAPGAVDTPLLWNNPEIKKKKNEITYSSPEKIASIIAFLASDEASSIHGTTVVADMGLLSILI